MAALRRLDDAQRQRIVEERDEGILTLILPRDDKS